MSALIEVRKRNAWHDLPGVVDGGLIEVADVVSVDDDFAATLRARLAQAKTLPSADWPELPDASTHMPAAVLVPLVLRDGAHSVLLTRRTDHLHHHPGQISFPGGRVERGDASPVATALRETEEEIGLAAEHVELLGSLPEYFTGTGFRVTPVVGVVRPPFDLTLDTFEVAEAFEVPLAHFLDPANHLRHSLEIDGRTRHFHAMPYGDYYIWGATAGMLMSLYRLIADAR